MNLRSFLNIPAVLERIENHLDRLESYMSDVRTEFNSALTDLGESITSLGDRLANLPDDPKDITVEDIASIKSLGARINDLAVAAPEIPTPEQPATPDQPAQPETTPPVEGETPTPTVDDAPPATPTA